MIKGIIFDMDGVLVDSEPIHYKAWSQAFAQFGIEVTKDIYDKKIQAQGYKNAIKNLIPDVTDELRDQISEIKMTKLYDHLNHKGLTLMPDAYWLIEALEEADIPMVIASSNRIADTFIEHTEKKDSFMDNITGLKIHHNKPHPEIFQLAHKALGFEAHEVLVIEDSLVGILAARRAGLNVIAINRGGELDQADVHHFESIIADLNLILSQEDLDHLATTSTHVIDNLKEVLPFILLGVNPKDH